MNIKHSTRNIEEKKLPDSVLEIHYSKFFQREFQIIAPFPADLDTLF